MSKDIYAMDQTEADFRTWRWGLATAMVAVVTLGVGLTTYHIAELHYASSDVHAVKREAGRLAAKVEGLDKELAERMRAFARLAEAPK